jgi:hypothetical protein
VSDGEVGARAALSRRYWVLALALIALGVAGLVLVSAGAYLGELVALFGSFIYVPIALAAFGIGVAAARPSHDDIQTKARSSDTGVLISLYLAPVVMWGLVTGVCYAMAGGG